MGLVIGIYLHGFVPTLIGGGVGFGIMLAFYFIGEGYVRYMAKKRGIQTDEVALGFGISIFPASWACYWTGLSSRPVLFAVLAGG